MRGAEWLIAETDPGCVLTPEKLTDDQRLIERTAAAFVAQDVAPVLDELEKKNWTLLRSLLKKAGDLGLLGTDVPEEYGGVGLDKATGVVVCDAIGAGASFATAFGGQTSLAILPILWFGTD